MGIMDFLLGEEEPRRLKDTYRGRNYEGPAHIQSLPFQGHPYMQMPGNSYVPPQPTAMPQPRQGATMSPWNPDTSNGIREETFYREGGPYYREGVHRNPNARPAPARPAPPLPAITPSGSYSAPQYPPQHIGGAVTNIGLFDDIKDFFTGQPEGQSDFEEALRDKNWPSASKEFSNWPDRLGEIVSKRPSEIRSDPMLEIAEAGLLNDIEYEDFAQHYANLSPERKKDFIMQMSRIKEIAKGRRGDELKGLLVDPESGAVRKPNARQGWTSYLGDYRHEGRYY